MTLAEVMAIYTGSNGEATQALYRQLEVRGTLGFIAANLFRAVKCSERAKSYRKKGFKTDAYERKHWSIKNLAQALNANAAQYGITWGWATDKAQPKHNRVLYVDIPEGQVSFHTHRREVGPNYEGEWDGARGQAPTRVCRLAVRVLAECKPIPLVHRANTEPESEGHAEVQS